nr:probable E3 ubiquitin-protein ligase RHY1A [Ipomoea batatas]GME00289.1 probable E3 ubiquitin-protein ligase RHY1A [Ipomoea batatas]
MATHNNSPNVGFLHRRGTVRLSFRARRSSEINPRFVAIEISLKFKHIFLGTGGEDGYSYQRSLGESTVSFPLNHGSSGQHLDAYLGNQFHRWMPALSPRVCGILSQRIVHSARRIGFANGGGIVVTASIEILDRVPPIENNVVDFFPHHDASSSKPRGLSAEEIKRLKEERFENGDDESSVCPVCLEDFLAGAKISPLPCSHVFHHGCIYSWLEKSASCPICRFDVTNHMATI